MMRKRSIISLLLAFCLCFSMIMPAMAAEVNAEAQIEAQAVSRLADFDFVQSADVNEATFSIDGESVLVQNLSETATLDEISKAELADVIDLIAGEQETSVMMHYHPELVNLNEAGDGDSKPFAISSLNEKLGWAPRHWDKATVDSGVGNPKKASAEKGERYVKPIIEKLAKLFTEVGQGELY